MLIDLNFILIPTLLIIAALFAAAEASLFSMTRSQLESLRELRPFVYHQIKRLVFKPDALLSTLVIGNECLNILIGTFTVAVLKSHTEWGHRLVGFGGMVLSALMLLLVSEIPPKIFAFRFPIIVASVLVYPTAWAHFLLTPFRRIFLFVSEGILRVFGVKASPPPVVSEQDFLTLVEVGAESGSLEAEEKERIINVFSFTDKPVSNVMTPWAKAFTVKEDISDKGLLDAVRKHGFSRVPVVDKSGDRVVGILYAKELIRARLASPRRVHFDIKEMLAPPYIVSTHKKISKLFREFRAKKVHIALVVDEYGRQIGIVTLEDVLNALFATSKREVSK